MLYVIATPIGNLEDITFRALDTLKKCDYILCEDTRHSVHLLSHYQISKPLKSFHKFNETAKEQEIIHDLEKGLCVGLITDAGTPGISDPGAKLIKLCVEKKLPVVSIPGACAAITALSCSGFDSDRFQFIGFLPRKPGELRKELIEILMFSGTTICYEAPTRMVATLEKLDALDPARTLSIARELTKKFEEVLRGTPKELIDQWKEQRLKGEAVLLISGRKKIQGEEWQELTPEQHVELMQNAYGLSRQEAIKITAELRGVSKRDVYNLVEKKEE